MLQSTPLAVMCVIDVGLQLYQKPGLAVNELKVSSLVLSLIAASLAGVLTISTIRTIDFRLGVDIFLGAILEYLWVPLDVIIGVILMPPPTLTLVLAVCYTLIFVSPSVVVYRSIHPDEESLENLELLMAWPSTVMPFFFKVSDARDYKAHKNVLKNRLAMTVVLWLASSVPWFQADIYYCVASKRFCETLNKPSSGEPTQALFRRLCHVALGCVAFSCRFDRDLFTLWVSFLVLHSFQTVVKSRWRYPVPGVVTILNAALTGLIACVSVLWRVARLLGSFVGGATVTPSTPLCGADPNLHMAGGAPAKIHTFAFTGEELEVFESCRMWHWDLMWSLSSQGSAPGPPSEAACAGDKARCEEGGAAAGHGQGGEEATAALVVGLLSDVVLTGERLVTSIGEGGVSEKFVNHFMGECHRFLTPGILPTRDKANQTQFFGPRPCLAFVARFLTQLLSDAALGNHNCTCVLESTTVLMPELRAIGVVDAMRLSLWADRNPTPAAFACSAPVPQCDYFLSHCWNDPAQAKVTMLLRYICAWPHHATAVACALIGAASVVPGGFLVVQLTAGRVPWWSVCCIPLGLSGLAVLWGLLAERGVISPSWAPWGYRQEKFWLDKCVSRHH